MSKGDIVLNSITEALYSRRSVRTFLENRPVEEAVMTELLKAAMAAPTAHNYQPWEFIAVTEEGKMSKIRELHKYSNYNAPAAFIVCGNSARFSNGEEAEFWVQDCSAAIQNIMLAAQDHDLGTVWLGIYPVKDYMAQLQKIFGIPEGVIPMGVVLVGYPEKVPRAKTKYNEEFVHWQTY